MENKLRLVINDKDNSTWYENTYNGNCFIVCENNTLAVCDVDKFVVIDTIKLDENFKSYTIYNY